MRFLIDMALSPALAVWLQQKGNDAKHAFDAGLGRARVLISIPAEEFATSLVVVDQKRIRKRRLPIDRDQN